MMHLDNVSVTYNGQCIALRTIKTSFVRGEFTVLIGPSGAGKSTLLRCLNFLTVPTTGSISVDGLGRLKLGDVLRQHRRNTAMIFQQHQLIPRLSALQNVLIGRLGYHATARSLFPLPKRELRIAFESLERVGLLLKANERVDALSGGQQQRVGIARALTQQPHIILADEPVASLDPATANHVLSLLHSICKEDNLSAVVSLHQVELAKAYADRIVGLSAGEIVFDGNPQALTADLLDKLYSSKDVQSNCDSVFGYNPVQPGLTDFAISEQQ
ncbi:MAG: phosphonate ABC transporter ATP-binding protein [Nitrospirae bacterium]|nr:phosphonate ABC transporter ATP-binding protein [Nitrospirota bacterium]